MPCGCWWAPPWWPCPLPSCDDHFYLYTLTGGAILLMAVLGLNLAISGGIISIGTAGFLLIGAYASALAQTRWHWNPLPATLLAAAVCASVGLVTAFPALKMGPFAVAVVTLMYATVAADLILRFTSFTGGSQGVASQAISFTPNQMWFLTAGVAGLFFVGHRNLLRSPMGRALMMGRRSEPVASSLRISTARFKLSAFTVYAGPVRSGRVVLPDAQWPHLDRDLHGGRLHHGPPDGRARR